jgi:hypothetical protein
MTIPKAPFKELAESPEFQKDFKRVLKKYRSLEEDFETFKNTALKAFHKLGQKNLGIFQIPGLGFEYPKVYKATKFACKFLKGKGAATGIRVIYAYYSSEDKMLFVELYLKADKENEDRGRIGKIPTNKLPGGEPRCTDFTFDPNK